MGSHVCRESFDTKSGSLLETIARPGYMSEEELDAALAEARPCAQLLCDRLSLALCFEETAASTLCKSVLPSDPGEMHLPDVEKSWMRPELYYCSLNYLPRPVLAFPKEEYRTVNDLRALWKKYDCRAPAVMSLSQTRSLFLPRSWTETDMLAEDRYTLGLRRCELAAYSTLFSLLSEGNYWLAVCNSKTVTPPQHTFSLLSGCDVRFSCREELELKLHVQCPSFETVLVE